MKHEKIYLKRLINALFNTRVQGIHDRGGFLPEGGTQTRPYSHRLLNGVKD